MRSSVLDFSHAKNPWPSLAGLSRTQMSPSKLARAINKVQGSEMQVGGICKCLPKARQASSTRCRRGGQVRDWRWPARLASRTAVERETLSTTFLAHSEDANLRPTAACEAHRPSPVELAQRPRQRLTLSKSPSRARPSTESCMKSSSPFALQALLPRLQSSRDFCESPAELALELLEAGCAPGD